jgi:hypothetical protein
LLFQLTLVSAHDVSATPNAASVAAGVLAAFEPRRRSITLSTSPPSEARSNIRYVRRVLPFVVEPLTASTGAVPKLAAALAPSRT